MSYKTDKLATALQDLGALRRSGLSQSEGRSRYTALQGTEKTTCTGSVTQLTITISACVLSPHVQVP